MSDVISSDTNERRPPTAMCMTATITAARVFTTAMRIHIGPARAASFMAATILRQPREPRLDLLGGALIDHHSEMAHARQHRDLRLRVRRHGRLIAVRVEGLVAVADHDEDRSTHGGE